MGSVEINYMTSSARLLCQCGIKVEVMGECYQGHIDMDRTSERNGQFRCLCNGGERT